MAGPRRPSTRFKKGAVYEYGVLLKNADPLDPHFAKRSIVRNGNYFINMGTLTIEDFLEKNPEHLKPEDTFTFYQRDASGMKIYLYAGNPSLPQDGLGDEIISSVPQSLQMTTPRTQEMTMMVELMKQQIEMQRETNKQVMDQLAQAQMALQMRNDYYEDQLAALRTQVAESDRRAGEWERRYNELDKEYKLREEYQDQVNGLQSKLTSEQSGMGMNDIMSLIKTLAPLIAGISGPGGAAGTLPMAGGPMPNGPMPQPVPQQAQHAHAPVHQMAPFGIQQQGV